jgi:hypothetical protein
MNAIYVGDFGAVGDGATPDANAIQLAIDKAIEVNKPLHFDAKTYLVEKELHISDFVALFGTPRCGVRELGGSGDGKTTLRAGTSMRSVLTLSANRTVQLRDIAIDGKRNATYCLYFDGSSLAQIERLTVTGAIKDGVHLARVSDAGTAPINDANRFLQLTASQNGTLYLTQDLRSQYVITEGVPRVLPEQAITLNATCSVNAGDRTVTFGGVDLTTLHLRPSDPIRIVTGVEPTHFLVTEVVSATELKVSLPPTVTASGLSFAIGSGDGYHEVEGHVDNAINTFDDGTFRSNAGVALGFAGGSGPRMRGGQVEYGPFWGIRVGAQAANIVSASLSPQFYGTYFEALSRKPFIFRGALSLGVYHVQDFGYPGEQAFDLPHPENVRGIYVTDGVTKSIGWHLNELPSNTLQDAKANGHFHLTRAILQPVNDAGTNNASTSFMVMRPGTTDLVLTGTPTFALVSDKIMILHNEGPAKVTLQDESVLAGSKFRLSSATFTMSERDTITMACDGTYWIEISRTVVV